jgi:hypothetical protein
MTVAGEEEPAPTMRLSCRFGADARADFTAAIAHGQDGRDRGADVVAIYCGFRSSVPSASLTILCSSLPAGSCGKRRCQ